MLLTLVALARLAPAEAASARKQEKAAALAEQAFQAEQAGAYKAAAKLADKALKLDPDCVMAHYALGETMIAVSNGKTSDDARWLYNAGLKEMQRVVQLSPDSFEGAIAANYLRPATDLSALDPPQVECAPAAQEAFSKAEAAWSAHDYIRAQGAYDTALQACPTNAAWWLNSGDAWYGLEDYAGAVKRYDKALELAPCYAPAYRFRADAEIGGGDVVSGLVDATRAVACNPAYDIGWTYLAGLWGNLDRRVTWKHPQLVPASAASLGTGEAQAWAAYWRVRAEPLPPDAGDQGVVDRLARAAAAGTAVWRNLPASERTAQPLWGELAEAEDAGVLPPAMFLWLMDEELAPVFARWRTEHLTELVAYVKDHLVEETR